MSDKPISQSKPEYNRKAWINHANRFLLDRTMPSSALDSAYIALRSTDPILAGKCREEAARRHKRQPKF